MFAPGFAPDYMRRNRGMLSAVVEFVKLDKPCAAICHGPWLLCSARDPATQRPVCEGRRCTSFLAIKDDVINAGGEYVDQGVVVDGGLITAQTPDDLPTFCRAIISAIENAVEAQ